MIYLKIEYLPYNLQKIYIKYHEYLDVILTYATLSKGYSSFANIEPDIFIEYLQIAIKIFKKAYNKQILPETIGHYNKKIKKLKNNDNTVNNMSEYRSKNAIYGLKDKYMHMLWTIKNDILHSYNAITNGLTSYSTVDNITLNDLIKIQNRLQSSILNDSYEDKPRFNDDTFYINRLYSVVSLINLVRHIMASLYKITGKNYMNAHAPLKTLLKDALLD